MFILFSEAERMEIWHDKQLWKTLFWYIMVLYFANQINPNVSDNEGRLSCLSLKRVRILMLARGLLWVVFSLLAAANITNN